MASTPVTDLSSPEFREAVKSVFDEWLAEQRDIAATQAAEQAAAEDAERVRLEQVAAAADAAQVAEAKKWDGHAHDFPKKPTDGFFVCKDCGHAEPEATFIKVDRLEPEESRAPAAGADPKRLGPTGVLGKV